MDMYAFTTTSDEAPHSSGPVESAIRGPKIIPGNNDKCTKKRGRPWKRPEELIQEQRSNKMMRLERWSVEAEQMRCRFLDEFKELVEQHMTETRAWISAFYLCLDEFKEQVEQDRRALISAMRQQINDMFFGLKQGFYNNVSLSLSLGAEPVQPKEDN